MRTTQPLNGIRCRILHVTDNEADHRLLKEIVREHPELSLTHGLTGESALEILDHPANADAQPNVVFLSWFLPAMSGEELLRRMKANARMKVIPVVVFTSLTDDEEINRMYGLGASCVVTKPFGLDEFESNMRIFAAFWGHVATLPLCRDA